MIPMYEQPDTRPSWARSMNLPSRDALAYVQTLTLAIIGAFLLTYMLARAVNDPTAPFKAAAKRVGV